MAFDDVTFGRGRGRGPWRPKTAFNSSPRGADQSVSYLWRVAAIATTAATIASCAPPEYKSATQSIWPFSRTAPAASGVIPAQLPTHWVQVRSDSVRQPPAQVWPFGRGSAQATQPFSIWYRVPLATIEPETFRQPVAQSWPWNRFAQPFQPLLIWREPNKPRVDAEIIDTRPLVSWPFYQPPAVVQASQPFSIWSRPQSVTIEPETILQPTVQAWPWNRFAQPFQPLLIWREGSKPRLDAELFGLPAAPVWPFGRSVAAAQASQPFSIWQAVRRPTLEAESYEQPRQPAWVWDRTVAVAQPSQPFSIWYRLRLPTLEPEQFRQPDKLSWPYGRAVAQWSWYTLADRKTRQAEPDDYRTADKAVAQRLYWITPYIPPLVDPRLIFEIEFEQSLFTASLEPWRFMVGYELTQFNCNRDGSYVAVFEQQAFDIVRRDG